MTKTMIAAAGVLAGMAVAGTVSVLAGSGKDLKKLAKKTAKAADAVGDMVGDKVRCMRG